MIEIKLKDARVTRNGVLLVGDVTVKIDDQYLAQVMARKALRNSSRKSVALGVVARATNVKEYRDGK